METLIALLQNRAAMGHFEGVVTAVTPAALPGIGTVDLPRVRRVVIRPGSDIAYTDDSTTVTSSHGMPILADEPFVYDGITTALTAFRMIGVGGSATVHVAYYGIDA